MKCITWEKTPEERIRYITDRVEAIHRVLPEMVVRPDIRWRLEEVWVAQELARRLRGHRIDSLESPIAKRTAGGTYSEWRRLRETIHLPVGDHVGGSDSLIQCFRAEALDMRSSPVSRTRAWRTSLAWVAGHSACRTAREQRWVCTTQPACPF